MSAALQAVPPPDPVNLAVALRLANSGIYVFPCTPEKKPYFKPGVHAATLDAEQIKEWWGKYPDALVGIACGPSRLFVFDCDVKNGAKGVSAFLGHVEKLGISVGGNPATQTPSGGVHCYFRLPDGAEHGNSVDTVNGIDTRGVGGYVIAAASVLPNSKRYAALDGTPDLADAFSAGTIPRLPFGLLDAVRAAEGR